MDVHPPRSKRQLLAAMALSVLALPLVSLAIQSEAPPAELISSSDLEQSYFADTFVLDDLSLEPSLLEDQMPASQSASAPPPVMISMRPSLWTGAVTMVLFLPVFGRFRRRLLVSR